MDQPYERRLPDYREYEGRDVFSQARDGESSAPTENQDEVPASM